MKENNIEEDIKILEEFIDKAKLYNPKTGKDIKPTQFGEGQRYVYSNVYYAIDHILSDHKRVLKENEKLKGLIAHKNEYTKKLEEDLFENSSNYVIPIQRIKDKIEELEKELLQELIEGRE